MAPSRKCQVKRCGKTGVCLRRPPAAHTDVVDLWRNFLSRANGVPKDKVPKYLFICDDHFDEADKNPGQRKLKSRCVPKFVLPGVAVLCDEACKKIQEEDSQVALAPVALDVSDGAFGGSVSTGTQGQVEQQHLQEPLMLFQENGKSVCVVDMNNPSHMDPNAMQVYGVDQNLSGSSCSYGALEVLSGETFGLGGSCKERVEERGHTSFLCVAATDASNTSSLGHGCIRRQGELSKQELKKKALTDLQEYGKPVCIVDMNNPSHFDANAVKVHGVCKEIQVSKSFYVIIDVSSAAQADPEQVKVCFGKYGPATAFNEAKRSTAGHTSFNVAGHPDSSASCLRDVLVRKYVPKNMPAQHESQTGLCSEDVDGCVDKQLAYFETIMNGYEWRTCDTCNECCLYRSTSKVKCRHGKKCKLYSVENNMDPGPVPAELEGLSYVEEQLIALVHPVLSVFKLKGHQYGYSGSVINFHQNVKQFAKQLPHRARDLPSIITVRTGDEVNHVDFRVRRDVVLAALKWLIANNPYYYEIQISFENLADLPEDGSAYDMVANINEQEKKAKGSCEKMDTGSTAQDVSDNNMKETFTEEDIHLPSEDCDIGVDNDVEDDNFVHEVPDGIHETYVPIIKPVSEKEKVNDIFQWPPCDDSPINEFVTVGYIVRAFPCLFPTGAADLRAPRDVKIPDVSYFKHMMHYKDKRFRKHPRFRYLGLNSLMRWTALKNGSVFVRLNDEIKDFSIQELKGKLRQDRSFSRKLLMFNANIQGTKSYWFARGQELVAMVEQLGMPTLFITLSAADLHWHDLFKVLAGDENAVHNLTEKERWTLVQENPMTVDFFFAERVRTLLEEVTVLQGKFKIKDYWYRIEYQHRGSPHMHGLLWIEGAPDCSSLLTASEQERQNAADYFAELVTAVQPSTTGAPSAVHPCRVQMSDIVDSEKDLSDLLSKVNMHTKCAEGYCLRRHKQSKDLKCRFSFPKELNDKARIVLTEDGKDVEYVPARNNPLLNKYNAYIIQCWRANMDLSPVVSKRALLTYLSKYVTKGERKSHIVDELINMIMDPKLKDKSGVQALRSVFIKLCCERDWGAQEVCHILLGLKLFATSGRNFVKINLNKDKNLREITGDGNPRKSFVEKYQARSAALHGLCLWAVAKNYDLPKLTKRRKEAVVQISPLCRFTNKDGASNEKFYRQEVLLYVPWKAREDEEFVGLWGTWKNAYEGHIATIQANKESSLLMDNVQPQKEDENYEDVQLDNNVLYSKEEWMSLADMKPGQAAAKVELGRRDVDLTHDWHKSAEKYAQQGGIPFLRSFLATAKEANKRTETSQFQSDINVEWTPEQHSVLNLLQEQIESIKATGQLRPGMKRTIIVQGKAGTGKSLLVSKIVRTVSVELGQHVILVLGPTGVAALHIKGRTVHSVLHINVQDKNFGHLKPKAAQELKKLLAQVKFVVLDEYSMIGCKMLYMIDQRLRQGKNCNEISFGNCVVYMFGDVKQLPPVYDAPCYTDSCSSMEAAIGKFLYMSFDGATILSQVKRQAAGPFQDALSNISLGQVTAQDYQLLQTRFKTSLTAQERKQFEDAMRLFPKLNEVRDYNSCKLENLKVGATNNPRPIARIPARHNNSAAAQGSTNQAEGLSPLFYLAEEARIMLRMNLWTEKGLVNGAVGEVVDIVYEPLASPPEDAPAVIVCKIESYKGPFLNDIEKTVPIVPVTKTWLNADDKECARSNFPICLCYACSVHKSQGLGLLQAVIDIGADKEMQTGLTYTGLSRVTSLEGLLLEPFSFDRLQRLNRGKTIQLRHAWEELLQSKHI